MQFFAVLLLTITLAVSTIATPFHVAERRDIAPPNIIVPQTRDKWILGFAALLCWDVDPQQDSDATGSAYLGNWLTEFDILSGSYSSDPSHYVCHRTHTRVDPQIASSFPLSIGCTNVDLDGVFPGFYTLFRKSSHLAFAIGRWFTGVEQWLSMEQILGVAVLVP